MDNEEIYELIESTANMLRGMTMDRSIPSHAREVMALKIKALDRALFHISVEPEGEVDDE